MTVADIHGRIAAIQATFGVLRPLGSAPAPAPAPAPSFAAVLQELDPPASRSEGRSGPASAAGGLAAKLPPAGQRWAAAIEEAADAAGVDPRLVAAVAWTESGFRAEAVSGAGATGLMQLMPATARGLGVDPHDPRQNLAGGARYLAEQLNRFGRVDHALAAYNAGPAAVSRHGGIPPFAETGAYVTRVLDRLQTL